jgi:phosphohistidine phosphatase
LTSPLLRTRQTAAALARHAGWPAAVETPELAPGESPRAVLALLRQERSGLVALVGHEPDLGELICLALVGQARAGTFEMKRFAAALLAFPRAARAGEGTLRWLVPPRLLRSLR